MKHLSIRDLKKRQSLKLIYIKKQCFKMIHQNLSLPIKYRYTAFFYLTKLKFIKNTVQYKNRCLLTNRGKGIESKFKLSRIMIKNLINSGLISQLQKASW